MERLESAVANIISVKLALGIVDTVTEGKQQNSRK